jgi:hypothetical protein
VKAFVTGGSGFVGGALVRPLVAVARSEASVQRVRAAGARAVLGDLADLGRTGPHRLGSRSCGEFDDQHPPCIRLDPSDRGRARPLSGKEACTKCAHSTDFLGTGAWACAR